MPRSYRREGRQALADQTRARILEAARELLLEIDAFTGFTVDAVTRRADVSRMTVYYQFQSKVGLLEALCDYLAMRGGMQQMYQVFQQPEPLQALMEYIRVLVAFFASDRTITRRFHGLAALDPDIRQVVSARDERRRGALKALVERIERAHGQPIPAEREETIDLLVTLLSFETFDSLAGAHKDTETVARLLRQLVLCVLRLDGPGKNSS